MVVLDVLPCTGHRHDRGLLDTRSPKSPEIPEITSTKSIGGITLPARHRMVIWLLRLNPVTREERIKGTLRRPVPSRVGLMANCVC